jgi:hypothetical protein
MKKTDFSVLLRDGVRKRLKQYSRLLSQSLTASLLLLMLMWQNPVFSQGNCSLGCHGAQVSLGSDCTAEITVGIIGDTSQCVNGDFIVYVITLQNDTLPNATVTEAQIGMTLIASLVDLNSGNSCWSYITVQDKMKPTIVCQDTIISCLEMLTFEGPAAFDNCSDPQVILINEEAELLCDPLYIKRITRTYIARDASGNESLPCEMDILLERIDFSLIEFPDSFTVANGNPLTCDGPWADADNDNIPDPLDDPPYLGTGVPTIDGIPIFPEFMGFCNALTTYEDVVLPPIGCVRKIMRVWTVREWHCTGEQDTLYVQLIEIVDNEGPHITCPANVTVTTTGHFCTSTVLLPPAVATDDCSPTVHVTVAYPGGFSPTNGGVYVSLPVGANVITYTAYDQCYNSSQCTMTITVQDLTPPIAICDEHTIVSLTLGGPFGLTKVPASVFDDGSYDACGPVTFLARRMDSCLEFDWTTDGAGVDEIPDGLITSRDHGTVFRPKVPFGCCDAGAGPIMVQLQVTDASGNVNWCMVSVTVQDKIPPVIVCPDDVTISCDFPVNVDNLDIFGGIAIGQSNATPFCVFDPTNPEANNQGFICGDGGFVVDNCGVTITETDFPNINNCGVGYIRRNFRATDANGFSECDQFIYIKNFDPITTNSIIWPLDYHGVECSQGTDPDDLPPPYDRPIIDEDQCDLVGINYDDLVFEFAEGACFKILRTWKVIEWCLYEQYGGLVPNVNYWTHVQVIKVINQFGPEFITDQPTIDRCNDFDCGGLFVELIQQAEDDCTADELLQWSYAVDLNNNGTIDLGPYTGFGNTIDASQVFPLGFHRVIYSFEDRCGNRTVREQLLNLRSCKAPTPVCIHGLSTDLMAVDTDGDGIEDAGMITIWASDFDASSYHACGFPFVLSLAPDVNVTSLTFDCDDVGQGQIPVNLYATDLEGNQAFCTTYIIIQDNNGVCPQGGNLTGTITGNVSTETSDNVLDVKVSLDGSTLLPINTNQSGVFTFPSMPIGGNYVVEPDKNNDFKNGVSTLDLLQIQKHLLGIKKLESPYKMIAADANNSKTITAIDLIELRKLILGIYNELPNNTSWRFVDKTYSFPDPYNPWEQVWPESVTLNPLSLGMNHADFYGIKVGDVNNTVKANATTLVTRGADEQLELIMDDRHVTAGETFEVPVYAGSNQSLEGIQFTFDMTSGLEVVEVKAGSMDVTGDNFAWLNNRTLSASWNKAEGITTDQSQPLFTLVLHAGNEVKLSQSISLTTAPTNPEVYVTDKGTLDLGLSFRGSELYSFELLQNEPNPFNGATQIGYIIPEAGNVTLELFDLAGRQLYTETVHGLRGLNKIEINKEQIGVQGLVYYQVQFQGFTATKKMLIL